MNRVIVTIKHRDGRRETLVIQTKLSGKAAVSEALQDRRVQNAFEILSVKY